MKIPSVFSSHTASNVPTTQLPARTPVVFYLLPLALALACSKKNDITAVAASCPDGFVDCNQDPADGCEVNVTADPKNCGACGVMCSGVGGVAECTASKCQTRCGPGF